MESKTEQVKETTTTAKEEETAAAAATTPEAVPKETEQLFTQEDVDRIVKERLARQNRNAEKDEGKAAAEATEKITALEQQLDKAKETIRQYQAKSVLTGMRIKQGREDALIRLADLSVLEGLDSKEYEDKMKEVLQDVVRSYPEFIEEDAKKSGFIKAGTKNEGPSKNEDNLRDQIRKGFGLK